MNFLTIVLDSCRYDSWVRAETPVLDAHFEVMGAGAQATYTFPAHASMFQGFYPTVNCDVPLYNRFLLSPFRWGDYKRPALKKFRRDPADVHATLPAAFQKEGYTTVAIGGVDWFKHASPLAIGFSHFAYEADGRRSIQQLPSLLREPFFGVLNLGETHRPYDCPRSAHIRADSPVSGNDYQSFYNPLLHSKQILAVEYLDECLAPLLDWLKTCSATFVCVCGDHGETFGEDGCYGHTFYHPNVMSVPLGWSRFGDGRSDPIRQVAKQLVKN